jgi:hypothetical protein
LKTDVGESRNLANDMPEKTLQLHSKLKAWLKKTNASRPQKGG